MPKCGLSKSLYSLDIFEWIWSHESAELRRFGAAEALRYEGGLGGRHQSEPWRALPGIHWRPVGGEVARPLQDVQKEVLRDARQTSSRKSVPPSALHSRPTRSPAAPSTSPQRF